MRLETTSICTICGNPDDDEIVMQGLFGMLPVAFCCWCFTNLQDMAEKLWFEDWKLKEEE